MAATEIFLTNVALFSSLCVDNVVNIYKKLLEFVWDVPADIELSDLQSVSAASTERKFTAICQQSLEFTSEDTFCSSI